MNAQQFQQTTKTSQRSQMHYMEFLKALYVLLLKCSYNRFAYWETPSEKVVHTLLCSVFIPSRYTLFSTGYLLKRENCISFFKIFWTFEVNTKDLGDYIALFILFRIFAHLYCILSCLNCGTFFKKLFCCWIEVYFDTCYSVVNYCSFEGFTLTFCCCF